MRLRSARVAMLRGLLCLVGGAALAAARAQAQGLPDPGTETRQSGWIVTVGAFGDLEPRFEGSRHLGPGYHPIIDYRAAGSREWLNLPNDGFDFALFETDSFRAGPVVNGRWERNVSSMMRGFQHVGDINLSAEAGVFLEWWPADYLRTRAEVRDAVIGARGVVADLSADWVWRPDRQWTWSAGPRLSIADPAFMRSYYSIDSQQAMTSGLAPYSASAGVRSLGAGSMLKYKWSESIATMGFVEYQRLAPPAADSPLIEDRGSPNQLTVGVGLSYSFKIGW